LHDLGRLLRPDAVRGHLPVPDGGPGLPQQPRVLWRPALRRDGDVSVGQALMIHHISIHHISCLKPTDSWSLSRVCPTPAVLGRRRPAFRRGPVANPAAPPFFLRSAIERRGVESGPFFFSKSEVRLPRSEARQSRSSGGWPCPTRIQTRTSR
jgi:hypothetical protein